MKAIGICAALLLSFGLGFAAGGSRLVPTLLEGGERAIGTALVAAAGARTEDATTRLLLEHPSLLPAILGGGAFGNPSDPAISRRMFAKREAGVQAAREITAVEALGPRTWRIRLPVSNALLFETDEGLVLVDTGVPAAGLAEENA